jgi:hypothetical protein
LQEQELDFAMVKMLTAPQPIQFGLDAFMGFFRRFTIKFHSHDLPIFRLQF